MKHYTITEFRKQYPTDDVCLEKLFQVKYGKLKGCPSCGVAGVEFKRISTRRCYQCVECGYQLYPTQGTIFEKTRTPLTYWFYSIYLYTVTRNGVAAKELERQLGVTYKTAFRMAKHIRILMDPIPEGKRKKLEGIVEIDETFIGGKVPHTDHRPLKGKIPVLAMVERQGRVIAEQIPDIKGYTLLHHITHNVDTTARVMTDELNTYKNLERLGYAHDFVKHRMKQYGKGDIYTNTVEGFFSMVKRTIEGTYLHVSSKYLQLYVDEITFRYNHRKQPTEMFEAILKRA